MNSTSASQNGQVNQAPRSAKTKADSPKVVSEPFAKLFDWIAQLSITAARRLLLSELVRYTHGRCFTWVGNSLLGTRQNVLPRQIQKQLKALEKAQLITIRKYQKSWCKTQRIIFVNRLAEEAGVDPLMILPTSQQEFFRLTCASRHKSSTNSLIECPVESKTDDGSIGCPVGHEGDVQQDTRRDQKDFLPLKRQRKSLSGQGTNHRWPEGRGSAKADKTKAEDSQSVQLSEAELVRQSQSKPSRPAMDWPAKNLPETNREAELAKKVHRKQVTHLHPDWLKKMGCWVVRTKSTDRGTFYHEPKFLADGFIEITNDTQVVPLIDSENRRVSQSEFISELMKNGVIKVPDRNQPAIE